MGVACVVRWDKEIEPKKYERSKPRKIDPEALALDVENNPDDYQKERAHRLGVKQSSICYALKRLGMTHKKKL